MTYTPPSQLAYRTLVTPDIWNRQVADNISFLHDRVESVWIPVVAGIPAVTIHAVQLVAALLDANTEIAGMISVIPPDFSVLTSLSIYLVAGATATFNYDLRLNWGALGEVYTTHSATSLGQTLALTSPLMYGIDVTSLVSATLAANDILNVTIENNGVTAVYVMGMLLRYTRL